MTPRRRTVPARHAIVVCGAVLLLAASVASAERADKEKRINFSADDGSGISQDTPGGTLKGNVIITQGTITIRADRIDFKQNPDNSMSATAYGNPISFRQKRDDVDEYYEGYAQRAVYDGSKELLELFDRALLKRSATDEVRSNYISYNSKTGEFHAEGRPDSPGAADGPGTRVRGVFQPRSDSPLGKGDAKDGKDKAGDAKDGKDKAGDAKDKTPAKAKALDKAPITLKPADEIKPQ
jgi:lipopolysaccharide export system protein LptA